MPRVSFEEAIKGLENNTLEEVILSGEKMFGYEITLDDAKAKQLFKALKDNHSVTTLNVHANAVSDDSAIEIADALGNNKTLISLSLSDNHLCASGIATIAEALCLNNTLTTLSLSSNRIQAEGAKSIALLIKSNTALLSLNLCQTLLGTEGVDIIARALPHNSTLQSLDISYNKIEEGIQSIIDNINQSSLIAISLRGNRLNKYIVKLIDILKDNIHLKKLDISDNNIDDDGIAAVAAFLQYNTTLTELNLSDSKISHFGVQLIAKALSTNTTLKHLNLWHSVDRAGIECIAQALKDNHIITEFDFTLDIYDPLHTIIKNILERNKKELRASREIPVEKEKQEVEKPTFRLG